MLDVCPARTSVGSISPTMNRTRSGPVLKPYRSRVDITPLMIETTVSLLTRLHNALLSEEHTADLFDGINVIMPRPGRNRERTRGRRS